MVYNEGTILYAPAFVANTRPQIRDTYSCSLNMFAEQGNQVQNLNTALSGPFRSLRKGGLSGKAVL